MWRPSGPGGSRRHGGTSQDGGNTTRGAEVGNSGRGGGERRRARTCLLVVGGVCVRARDSVCYNIRVSLSWVLLQVLVLRQALDVALLKDLLHHLVLVSSNKPGQAARQQHPDQL